MELESWNNYDHRKQYALVSGYIRNNYYKHIPPEIVLMCSLFFAANRLDIYVEILKKCKLLPRLHILNLYSKLKQILMEESNLVHINLSNNDKLIVVGDVRAQFYDLTINIFEQFGYPNDDKHSPKYLFLGNYVSKGHYHTETLLLLFSLKARYPSKITLLRGRHEARQISQVYGFRDDVIAKYGNDDIWKLSCDIFHYLPLCCLINQKIFAIHSGLSPSFNTLNEISLLNRFQEIPVDGIMCDLVWSIPNEDDPQWAISPKGAGFCYGQNIVQQFCEKNNIDLIIRSSCFVGIDIAYRYLFNRKLLHIFSAPNFAYRCGNKGSVAILGKDSNVECKTFSAVPDEKRPDMNNKIPEYFI
eukprot:290171_1